MRKIEPFGPDVPESPYPVFLSGIVTQGYGRGSKVLGIPTGTLLVFKYLSQFTRVCCIICRRSSANWYLLWMGVCRIRPASMAGGDVIWMESIL